MNLIYSKLAQLIPCRICAKFKENEDILIVSTESSDILYLNETSKDFYLLCDESRTIEEIVNEMTSLYDVSKEEIEDDIVSMIRDMQWNNILDLKELQ